MPDKEKSAAQLLKEFREKKAQETSSTKSTGPQKRERTDPNKVDPYNSNFVEALYKKGYSKKQINEALPAYLFDKSTGEINPKEFSRAVDQYQGLREGKKNTWGKYDWSDPSYMEDFNRRHNWYTKENPNFNPEDPGQVENFQNAYNQRAKQYGLPEYFAANNSASKFKVDKLFGQNTYSAPSLNEIDKPITPEEPAVVTDPVVEAAKNPAVPTVVQTKADHLIPVAGKDMGSPWWLQDIIKTGHAAGNFARIKKYNPWQATPNVMTPEVSFLDPTRELAANSEMANQAYNAMAQFTGPQSLASNISQVQGKALSNAADINSRYNNANVQISNQQENQNAAIMNNNALYNAEKATNLWDKYQITNQQFDNSKSQARDALVSSFVNGITNANYTANLNDINPQFTVNPSVGGRQYFHNPRSLKANNSQQPDFTTVYNDLLRKNPTLKADPKHASSIALKLMGMQAMPENPYLDQSFQGVIPNQYPE